MNGYEQSDRIYGMNRMTARSDGPTLGAFILFIP